MVQVKIDSVKVTGKDSPKKILQNVYFELSPNKVYTILGKNGSGKTTLINSITGLLDDKVYSVLAEVKLKGVKAKTNPSRGLYSN